MVVWSFILQSPGQQVTPAPGNNDNAALLGWLAGLALAVIVVTLVAQPLQRESKRRKQPKESQYLEKTRLEGLHESALAESRALQDLEFDRELGIIEETDYLEFKQRSEARLDALKEEIELLQHKLTGQNMPPLEKAGRLAGRNRVGASPVPELRPTGATVTRSKTGETGKFYFKAAIKEKLKCGECAAPFRPGDRFCRQCSAPLPLLCLNCGKEVTEDDRFCAGCGSAVNT